MMSSEAFHDAHDFVIHALHQQDNTIINNYTIAMRPGLGKLLAASMPDAFHDSSARYPPPRCHPKSRRGYIDKLTEWGISSDHKHILWMYGPAGAGKTAIAQTSAERLAEQGMLGGSIFFSRSNQRHNPNALFTSLAYQLTTKVDAYADTLDRLIARDPTLVTKSIQEQFQELLVKPLQKLQADGVEVNALVFIVDGLDECEGANEQCDIVEIVVQSIRERSTPFRWMFVSRPETRIVASFNVDDVPSLSFHIELSVSREIDHEILCFLTDELHKIRKISGLPSSWPSEHDLQTLVDLCAGLWVYAATVVRFVGDPNSNGAEDQLYAVLALAARAKGRNLSGSPLSELDLFYTLIMERVPPKTLLTIQKILLLKCLSTRRPPGYFAPITPVELANILRLTEPQFCHACGALRSVMRFDHNKLIFYHMSFMDFIQDPQRSGKFSIFSGCQDILRWELLERLNNARSFGREKFRTRWPQGGDVFPDNPWVYLLSVQLFFILFFHIRPLDSSMATSLLNFHFETIPRLCKGDIFDYHPTELQGKIPPNIHRKIVCRSYNPLVYLQKPDYAVSRIPYILGRGENKIVLWKSPVGWRVEPYPSL